MPTPNFFRSAVSRFFPTTLNPRREKHLEIAVLKATSSIKPIQRFYFYIDSKFQNPLQGSGLMITTDGGSRLKYSILFSAQGENKKKQLKSKPVSKKVGCKKIDPRTLIVAKSSLTQALAKMASYNRLMEHKVAKSNKTDRLLLGLNSYSGLSSFTSLLNSFYFVSACSF